MTNLSQLFKTNEISSKFWYEINISKYPLIPSSPLKQDGPFSLNLNTWAIPNQHLTSECLVDLLEFQPISSHVVTGTIVQVLDLTSGILIAGEVKLRQHLVLIQSNSPLNLLCHALK